MSNKLFQVIRPRSLTDPAYAEHEYLIRWTGRDGGDLQYMFYDAEIEKGLRTNLINESDPDTIQAVGISETRAINLTATDLTKNDLEVIWTMLQSKYVTRIKLDGTIERYAPDSNSLKYRLIDGRYNIEFALRMSEVKLWR